MKFTLPESFKNLLDNFTRAFSSPESCTSFVALVCGWVLCTGRCSISRVIQWCRAVGVDKHHSAFYRFFSDARWTTDNLGAVLIRLALRFIDGQDVKVVIDDTRCRRSGPHLWGAGMHMDPLRSTYGRRAVKRVVSTLFGHCWVVASLWVPLPWKPGAGIAVPVAARLYRPKKRCPEGDYYKLSELGGQLIALVRSRVPEERRVVVAADTEYACNVVVRNLPPGVEFIGPMHMKAAFYAPPPPRPQGKRGPDRKKGDRLPSPQQLIDDDQVPWQRRTINLYGRQVDVLVKTQVGLWYHVAGTRPVRMIVTRDPKGRIEDRAYFTTDPNMGVDEIASGFSCRWSAEVMHRDVKQHLGLEEPQNGWWRRPAGERRPRNAPGPQPHAHRGKLAAGRTVPFVLFTYSIVVLWYLQHGRPDDDVARVRRLAPWYRHKKTPSFADMLAAARRKLWAARFSAKPISSAARRKSDEAVLDLLLAA